jgi:hypothetical protein
MSAYQAGERNSPSTPSLGRRIATETKQAFKTTEFWSFVVLSIAILISAAVISGGDNSDDQFIARNAWLFVAILAGAYMVSRGLAKSGSYEKERQRTDDGGNRLAERLKGDTDAGADSASRREPAQRR